MHRRHTGIIGVYYAWTQGRAGSDVDVAEIHACRNNYDFELDEAGHSLTSWKILANCVQTNSP